MADTKSFPLWILMIIGVGHQIIMSATFPVARYVLLQTDPLVVAFIRFCLSAMILLIFARNKSKQPGVRKITPGDKKTIVFLGFVIVILNQTLFLIGQKYTSAAHGALLFAFTPIFVYLMAINHLGEKFSKYKGIGIILAVAGSAIVIFENGLNFNYSSLIGDAIILIAVAAWAVYTVYGKPLVEKYGAIRITAYSIGAGSIMYFPIGLYRLLNAQLSEINLWGWLSILYISIVTSVIGYVIWYWLVKQMEASRVSVFSNLQPLLAGILGYYLLGEIITIPFLIGGAIIIAGVFITQLK